ncbi:prephenate dehydratase [Methyloceanibacter caenitepidi]|uniref:prephenate dehydratase n=1 Tax=Methyloceanibacter caenitepidi TaxID=1384459 RepID=A0A0A8K144_9HYPH|nr:prephenate dehydratase [Methyloceanibacter caenitepidi]BAQ16217.1 prephenate dehydratase [Methyloceanibacter caenitepidi]
MKPKTAMATKRANRIAFQGEPGANSHLAANDAYPDMEAVPCATFEDALAAVKTGAAKLAMIPIENSVAGRVADIHHLLPDSGLYIIGEHFERIRHQLLTLPGAKLSDLKSVHSHIMALGQCRKVIAELRLKPVTEADTAGAARHVSEAADPTQAAIASKLAAEIYGLRVAKKDVEDAAHNTTRFVILSAKPVKTKADDGPVLTTFVFRVRNVPAALYKALGGFATNGVNMTKLESYQLEGSFNATMFYADIEGHPDERPVQLAMEELDFYTSEITLLGTYPASPFRSTLKA